MNNIIEFNIQDNKVEWYYSNTKGINAMGTLSIDSNPSGKSLQNFSDNLETVLIRLSPKQYEIITTNCSLLSIKLLTLIELATHKCNIKKTYNTSCNTLYNLNYV